MKIVINVCYGGFGLSLIAQKRYLELKGKKAFFYTQVKWKHRDGKDLFVKIGEDSSNILNFTLTKDCGNEMSNYDPDAFFSYYNIERTDPDLIRTVEELREKANGGCSELKIIEVPDNIEWVIKEYDGLEHIAEKYRTWY